jgi:uncharacterized membrane protein YhaH (DUF805 family)
MEWMILPLRRYAQFQGRSRRKEFWMWILFIVIVSFVLSIFDSVLGLGGQAGTVTNTARGSFYYGAGVHGGILTDIFTLAVLVPNISVSVRRLHDTNRSGWWLLLPLVPWLLILIVTAAALFGSAGAGMLLAGIFGLAFLICAIVLLVWYCTAGTVGPNRFGEDPKGGLPADLAATFE